MASGLVRPGYHERALRRTEAERAWIELRAALKAQGIPHQVVDVDLQQIRISLLSGRELKVWRIEGHQFGFAVDGIKTGPTTDLVSLLQL